MKLYLYAAIGVAILAGLSTLYYWGYSAGKQQVVERLQNDRITILRDGKKVDEKVFAADDDALYCMLVECVPDR